MTAWARILLRYVVGAAFFGSTEIGRELAADPDLVEVVAIVIGLAVEGYYVLAKRNGWSV